MEEKILYSNRLVFSDVKKSKPEFTLPIHKNEGPWVMGFTVAKIGNVLKPEVGRLFISSLKCPVCEKKQLIFDLPRGFLKLINH